MRFACQSCGKAYNLPEERIADKSNVKLKCRVCGAIVEVKRQGELVALTLDETEARQELRVSEAPAPLTSITPEDDDDPDGATVSISEASINDRGPLELEMPMMPPAAATGFASPLASAVAGGGGGGRLEANVAPPLPPPPLSPSSLPPPPPLRGMEAPGETAAHASNGASANGSAAVGNGVAAFFPDPADAMDGVTPPLRAPVAPVAAGNLAASNLAAVPLSAARSAELGELPTAPAEMVAKDPTFKLKMAAAFVTGVLIDRIVSGLFN